MKGRKLAYAGLFILTSINAAGAATSSEIYGGVYVHDVDTPLNKSGIERGADVHLGWRGNRIGALRAIGAPSPHAFVSLNSAGDTDFAAAGINWKIGRTLYLRPGIGIAVHDGPSNPRHPDRRIDFGSRILFEPELGFGYQLSDRVSVEASWVHLSHAQLFSRQNPGIDNFGILLNYRFR